MYKIILKISLLITGIYFLILPVFSQSEIQSIKRCGTQELLERKLKGDPAFLIKWNNQQIQRKEYKARTRWMRDDTTLYSIPVVVHIIHNNGPENISDSAVYSQIEVLNNDYRRNPGTLGYNENPVGADTRIVFCLAQKDPNGNPTKGIIRVQDSTSGFTNDFESEKYLKKLSYWDATKYLNIWVCNLVGGLLGFGTFPGGDPAMDGIVIYYRAFGTFNNTYSPYNYGRTTTHEIGHYLNLFHPWGDAAGDCSDDDGISDTPLCSGEYTADKDSGCKAPTQCGFRRQVENYMDYSDDFCMRMFTKGQSVEMRSVISLFRNSLISTANLTAAGIEPGCGFVLGMSPDKSETLIGLFSIFPNPNHGIFTLKGPQNFFNNINRINIYDYQGRIIQPLEYSMFSGEYIRFNLNKPAGVYFLHIQTDRKNIILPFVNF